MYGKALRTNPSVSTSRWRFLPLTFLAPSYPLSSPPTPVVLAECGGLGGVRVRYCGAGLRASPEPSAKALADRTVHHLLGTVEGPSHEVVVEGLPRRSKPHGKSRHHWWPLLGT